MGSAEKFSKFKLTSFGNKGVPNTSEVKPIEADTLHILQERLWELKAKMEELYNRPRMPYTYNAEENDVLFLEHEPVWAQPGENPITSAHRTVYSLLGYATGVRNDNHKHRPINKRRQPYRHLTVSGSTISTTTTTDTTTPTGLTTTTTEENDAFGGWFDVEEQHWEDRPEGGVGWAVTSTYTTIFWNEPPGEPGTFTDTTYTTNIVTLETIEVTTETSSP
jgi:hypothetical protein